MAVALRKLICNGGYVEEKELPLPNFKEKLCVMNEYRKQNHLCDVVLLAGEREFPAHRAVLSASSKFFEGLFTSQMKETSEEKVGVTFARLVVISWERNRAKKKIGHLNFVRLTGSTVGRGLGPPFKKSAGLHMMSILFCIKGTLIGTVSHLKTGRNSWG